MERAQLDQTTGSPKPVDCERLSESIEVSLVWKGEYSSIYSSAFSGSRMKKTTLTSWSKVAPRTHIQGYVGSNE